MSQCTAEKQGLEISEVSRETFLDFVRRHATSEEIGRIGTCLDGERADAPAGELLLLGLMGCSKVCAVLCCQIVDAGNGNAGAKVISKIARGVFPKPMEANSTKLLTRSRACKAQTDAV